MVISLVAAKIRYPKKCFVFLGHPVHGTVAGKVFDSFSTNLHQRCNQSIIQFVYIRLGRPYKFQSKIGRRQTET